METYIIVILCIASFFSGFVDAIVGGGGLIQTPVTMIMLPNLSVANVIGSLKIPAFSGTSFATYQYLKRVDINWRLLLLMAIVSFCFAYLGSNLLTIVSNDFMKPLLLLILVGLAIYTFRKKDFGQFRHKNLSANKQLFFALLISMLVGFYDGFIGPGTGSFLVLAFVSVLGFDFLHASANAKMVNLATNFGSICLFVSKGKIIWAIAIPMAFCNALGGFLGSKLAIKKGNSFIRIFFLAVVILALLRFGYDVFFA
ncbi:sulfite exporter TauE/SafE family protein [Flavobacterium capsici]|uniref:Probable membrane transporter protein n=1 Tax=Flavobacterium capsici TaxID=3075618 RepID=A0AA96F7H5_9FLAO|nr:MULTISPECIES: TSUP family transporter [unclassified Flavobacterium]WNM19010.1 TSUP family transporter [Flavobacterium sp. PMR2A8]WNM23060.1 TSUP family transporter [Flavobacterium sp. PMTSA4]